MDNRGDSSDTGQLIDKNTGQDVDEAFNPENLKKSQSEESFESFLKTIFETSESTATILKQPRKFELNLSLLMDNRSEIVVVTESAKLNSAATTSSSNNYNNSPGSLQQPINTALTSSTLSANFLNSDNSGFQDTKSPFPRITFSPIYTILTRSNLTVKKNIEELLESEEYYINCLKVIINYYIDPYLYNNSSEVPVPLSLMSLFLRELIQIHSQILCDITTNYAEFNQRQQIDTLVENTANDITKSEYSIYIYQEYCNVYENVLQLLGQPNSIIDPKHNLKVGHKISWNLKWLKGWELYLEASQPRTRHLDLSFPSLIQKPTARMGKYKLILEAINKTQKFKLAKYVHILSYNLNWINANCKNYQTSFQSSALNDIINFQNILEGSKLNSEFFGNLFLVGYMIGIWVESRVIKNASLAAILYKSHLLLVEVVDHSKYKCDIKFIIPLSKCQLIKEIRDTGGGLYYDHPYCIKLLFEEKYVQYELLLTLNNRHEFMVWNNYLDTHINVINGPYKMDFSCIEISSLCKVPNFIIPYNVSLNYMNTKYTKLCYFNESKVFKSPIHQINKNDGTYFDQELMSHDDYSKRNCIENIFEPFWSKREIPLLTIKNEVESVEHVPNTLKKSFSQTSTRLKHSIKSNFKSTSNLYEFWKSSNQKKIK